LIEDLGFILYYENIWFKYKEANSKKIPHFVLTTTITPERHTFIVRNLLEEETIKTNSSEDIRQFIIKGEREEKLKKILD
jgi:hypothetical protein